MRFTNVPIPQGATIINAQILREEQML